MDPRVNHPSRLNFLRGIAVLLVVSVHASQIVGNGDQSSNSVVPISKKFLDFGARGVQIFFILSAFGLAKSYEVHSEKPIRSFYARRFFRIYPVWIFAVFILGYLGYQFLEIPSIKIGTVFSAKFLKPKGLTNA